MIRALCKRHRASADFFTSEYCRPLTRLFERQSCVRSVIVPEEYRPEHFGCGGQPWQMPVRGLYDAAYQLGFRTMPSSALHDHIAVSAGLPCGLPILYEYDDCKTLAEPYIVCAPRGVTTFAQFFREVAERSLLSVVEVGAAGEGTGRAAVDLCGRDMLDVLPWLARSSGFVGLMSAMLVLANGFPIPRVAVHDGRSWDMRHVVRSPLNHYPVLPTAEAVLAVVGAR